MLTKNCQSFKRRRRARVYQNLFDEIFSLERELDKSKRELVRKEEQIKMMKRREVKLTTEIVKAKAHKSLEGLRNSTTEVKNNFADKVHVFFTHSIQKYEALIFIGPESDHCLPLSLTHSLTD